MRRLVLLCCAAVLVGCAKKESTPAADTTAAAEQGNQDPVTGLHNSDQASRPWELPWRAGLSVFSSVAHELPACTGSLQDHGLPALRPERGSASGRGARALA